MRCPWPWLVLVAMAAATTPQPPSAVDFQAQRYIDDDVGRGNSDGNTHEDNSNNDQGQSYQNHCPEMCSCYFKPYPSLGTFGPLLTVNCSGQGLTGFTAIFPNGTQVLDMSHNKLINITTLPPLPDLLVLDVSSNWMRYLDNLWVFEQVPKLRVLSLANNGLQSLQHGSFSGLGDLRELDLSRNIIKRIETHSFSGLGNLEVLKLQNNELYQLRREWLLPLTSLTSLYLGNNFVAKLELNTFSKLGHLHHLDLSYNSLRYILEDTLAGLGNLKLLNLSGNSNLRSVPSKALQPFSSLSILLLDGVAMSRLQPFGVSSIGVQEISLSFLPRLRVVEKSAFYNLTSLRTLQLHDNPHLVFLHPSAFSVLPFLRHLFIHNNGLIAIASQIITSLPSLTDLHLHHNPLHCDCNIFWLRKELNRAYQLESKSKLHSGMDDISGLSNETVDWNTTSSTTSSSSSSSSSPLISSNNSGDDGNSSPAALISEPDRVSCFFPAGKSSMPLIQLPIQYFSPTCPPTTLPLFSAFINVSIGEELWLECQGLGVPTPTLSWILPGGLEVNYSTSLHPANQRDTTVRSSVEIIEDSLLYIQSVQQSNSGSYGCRAASVLGDDISTTVVHVQNKPLALTEVKVSNDYITVSWKGSIPRIQMSDFQLFYRHVPTVITDEVLDGATNDSRPVTSSGKERKYDVIFLHSSVHKCTITGLKPESTYEVCLMYKQIYPVECHNYTTTLDVDVVSADGIMRVSKAHLGIGVASVLGVLLLVVLALIARRIRHRKDYLDPVTEEDKTSIPLEGMTHTAPSTPLTTSRTALLVNNQI